MRRADVERWEGGQKATHSLERAVELACSYGIPVAAGSDAHDADGVGAAYLEMPDFDGPKSFLAALADATVTGEYRPHAIRYPRRGSWTE